MGEKSEEAVYKVFDGETWQTIQSIENVTLDDDDTPIIKDMLGRKITLHSDMGKLKLALPCRSRKRFIKLLMSWGWSRNDANAEAEKLNKYHIPYKLGIFLYI